MSLLIGRTAGFVGALLYETKAVSSCPWTGGVRTGRILILPSIKLAVDLHVPFGNDAHKRKRLEYLPEQNTEACEEKCLEGPRVRETQTAKILLEEVKVSKKVVDSVAELHRKLEALEEQKKKISRLIEETSFLFNRQCDYLQNCFETPPKDPIVPFDKLLGSIVNAHKPNDLRRIDRMTEYFDGLD